MQFIITAHDGADALEKRMRVRPRHLENMAKLSETGRIICAGGILDGNGQPVGSALVVEFASRKQVDAYLAGEPYVIEKVWEDIRVETMNVVIENNEMVGK